MSQRTPPKAVPKVEHEEPVFTDTGYFEDLFNIPVDAVIEYVVSEGKKDIPGLVEEMDGTLVRIAEAEDPDIVPEVAEVEPEDLGRGKRNCIASRLYTKDWEYTNDRDVNVETKRKRSTMKMTRGNR